MPKIWILSDLHLEGFRFPEAFRVEPPVDFDVLVHAGDAWSEKPERGMEQLRRLAGDRPVVAVPGNHCSWGRRIAEAREVCLEAARANGITWLDDDLAVVGGVRFLGATLWSDYGASGQDWHDSARTGDDVEVGEGSNWKHLKVGHARDMHRRSRDFLKVCLSVPFAGPTVVVTHMAPLVDCVPPGSRPFVVDNSASDLSDLTDAGRAALWVHGHLHSSYDAVRPGGTRVLRNAAGVRFSNPAFDERLVVEV